MSDAGAHEEDERPQSGLRVFANLVIPESELRWQQSRSSGPGGQNVNKVNTRVELFFDVRASQVLSAAQKRRIEMHLASRTSKLGVLRVVSQTERTQARNVERARLRLVELLTASLRRQPVRKPTRPTRAAKRKRVETKKQRSAVKRQRRKPTAED